MCNICIFEDQYENIQPLFNWVSKGSFSGKLKITNYVKTEVWTNYLDITSKFDVIFVDIELANKSADDGIGVIKKLILSDENVIQKIIIITGHSGIKELIAQSGIPTTIEIIEKPITKEQLLNVLKRIIG
jgi:DNA-binding NtrC family response regulator